MENKEQLTTEEALSDTHDMNKESNTMLMLDESQSYYASLNKKKHNDNLLNNTFDLLNDKTQNSFLLESQNKLKNTNYLIESQTQSYLHKTKKIENRGEEIDHIEESSREQNHKLQKTNHFFKRFVVFFITFSLVCISFVISVLFILISYINLFS